MLRLLGFAAVGPLALWLGATKAPGSSELKHPFYAAQYNCGYCWDCRINEFVGHGFQQAIFQVIRVGVTHECYNIDCTSDIHPTCPSASAPLREVNPVLADVDEYLLAQARAVANGSVDALTAMLVSNPGRVRVNWDRKALQVAASCSPKVAMAHIPLNEEQLGSIKSRATPASPSNGE